MGRAAVALAKRGGARVIVTVTRTEQVPQALEAGADHALRTGPDLPASVAEIAGQGVERIVEVAFGANAVLDAEILAPGGVIAAFSTGGPEPVLPFWPLASRTRRCGCWATTTFPLRLCGPRWPR
ncbi:zinc-binding dehydrogenase [Streptomyces sp. NPDC002835]